MDITRSDTMDAVKRVGIWIRVSTEDQAKGESPEHHEKRARAYAEAKGWTVAEVYHLEGVSGKAVMHHAEAQRMLADIKRGHVQGLIFSKLARLARNTKELLEFADLFRQHGADLISLQESIDTSTPAGRLFYTMIAAMAQWEREEIAERIAVSIPIRAKLGKPIGGIPPYGYHWKDRKLVINPQEAPIRKLLYELFAEHKRHKTVARIVNAAGHRTRRGGLFTDSQIRRILADPTAKGVHRANFMTWKDGRMVYKPQKDWVVREVEPIVSVELWERVNVLLEDRKYSPRIVAKKPVHLFAGTAFCTCGHKMYVPSNTPKYVCKQCRNKIPIIDLEGVFREQLKSFFMAPDDVAKYLHDADDTLKQKQDVLASLLRERQQVAHSMERVYQLFFDGQLSSEGFGSKYKPLEERSKQQDAEIPRLQAEIDLMKINYLSQDDLLANARNLYDRWPKLPEDEKHKIAESLVHKITIGKGEIDMDLCYIPSPAPNPAKDVAKGQRNV